jgi:hypothetical protein
MNAVIVKLGSGNSTAPAGYHGHVIQLMSGAVASCGAHSS